MNNTAGSKMGQSPLDAVPNIQQISSADPNQDPFGDYSQGGKTQTTTPPPVLQQNTQQVPALSGSEQTSTADEDDKDDRIQAVKQEVVTTEATPPRPEGDQPLADAPVLQPAHPEIEIQKELSEIVRSGPDAERKDLPEEPERLGDVAEETQVQEKTAEEADYALPMTYGEAMTAKRKERSIKNGISWIIRDVIKQWKERFLNKKANK